MSKPKKRTNADAPATLDRADEMLAELGRTEAALRVAEAELEERLRQGRESYAPALSALEDAAGHQREALEEGAAAHPEWFPKGARSVALTHGRIGWRWVWSVRLKWAAEKVVAALRTRGLVGAILVDERPNKDILATYDHETLAAVGAAQKSRERFFVEVKDAPAK